MHVVRNLFATGALVIWVASATAGPSRPGGRQGRESKPARAAAPQTPRSASWAAADKAASRTMRPQRSIKARRLTSAREAIIISSRREVIAKHEGRPVDTVAPRLVAKGTYDLSLSSGTDPIENGLSVLSDLSDQRDGEIILLGDLSVYDVYHELGVKKNVDAGGTVTLSLVKLYKSRQGFLSKLKKRNRTVRSHPYVDGKTRYLISEVDVNFYDVDPFAMASRVPHELGALVDGALNEFSKYKIDAEPGRERTYDVEKWRRRHVYRLDDKRVASRLKSIGQMRSEGLKAFPRLAVLMALQALGKRGGDQE